MLDRWSGTGVRAGTAVVNLSDCQNQSYITASGRTTRCNSTVNSKRPVNLDLSTIHFPITAIVSILHRISGVALFAGIAVLLWMLDASLASPESFLALRELLALPLSQAVLWLTLAALAYHAVAGVRHLIMDIGIGESLEGGQVGAKLVLFFALVAIVLAGVWIW